MHGQNNEYFTLIDLDIEVKYVGEIYGQRIGEAVLTDGQIHTMNFPRIKYPGLKSLGYKYSDYALIARNIIHNFIEVLARKKESLINPAKYCSIDSEDGFFLLNESTCQVPTLEVKRLIHEFTHAIQDWKKVDSSILDSEVDAHFAEALYMANGGMSYEDENNDIMNTFLPVAEEFVSNIQSNEDGHEKLNKKLLRANEAAFRQVIFPHYEKMHRDEATEKGEIFNNKKFKKGFRKRNQWDGFTHLQTNF